MLKTLKTINNSLVDVAVKVDLKDGKLRAETALAQTDIHHRTDNTLISSAMSVVTRSAGRLFGAIGRHIERLQNRTCVACRCMQENQRMTSRERKSQQREKSVEDPSHARRLSDLCVPSPSSQLRTLFKTLRNSLENASGEGIATELSRDRHE
jgi:hypothetical protein